MSASSRATVESIRTEAAYALGLVYPDPDHYDNPEAYEWVKMGWTVAVAAMAQLHQSPKAWADLHQSGQTDVDFIKLVHETRLTALARSPMQLPGRDPEPPEEAKYYR